MYLEAYLDKHTCWQGEPLLWRCCLWRCVDLLSNPSYMPPTTTGFVALAAPQRDRCEERGGRVYVGNELSMHLIPQQTGLLSVGSVQIRFSRRALDVAALVEFADFFEGLFRTTSSYDGSGGEQALLVSPAVDVEVKPLPQAGRPACFSGAVGQYTMSASLDRQALQRGEPLTLKLRIEGEGNVALFDTPPWQETAGVRLLQQRSQGGFAPVQLSADEALLSGPVLANMALPRGERTFEYTLIPEKAGRLAIAVPSFSYFDPRQARYITLKHPPLPVEVKPGSGNLAMALGPKPMSSSDVGCLGGARLSGLWRWLLLSPLLGLIIWLFPAQPRRCRLGYMRRRRQRGATLGQVWIEWQETYLGSGLRREQVLATLAQAGISADKLDELHRALDD